MRSLSKLDRRISALEAATETTPTVLLLDRLTTEELERLEQLVIDRDAGRWTDVSELSCADLRIISSIQVASRPYWAD